MDFDTVIDRTNAHSAKWDNLQGLYGLSAEGTLSMWVADMDFRSPECVIRAGRRLTEHGVFGYRGDYDGYNDAISWWMKTRHGWDVKADEIFTTCGLINGMNLCLWAFTQPGDEVIIFTPVYHVFSIAISAAGRKVRECALVVGKDGRHHMDFAAYEADMTGREKAIVLCSPHNPGGRVWTAEELRDLAGFAARHNLLIISDEIHHDLIFPGNRHVPLVNAAPEHLERIIMMAAPSKTFNVAGNHAGMVIIQDPAMKKVFSDLMAGLHIAPTIYGTAMTEAAYTPQGAEWLESLMVYLAGNARIFLAGMDALPGVAAMPMQATYLSWIDFNGTGMSPDEVRKRVVDQARIAPGYGPAFGTGGEGHLRFNLGMPRVQIQEAVSRLHDAFADL
ncbi:MAG: putative C-S lyase [Rhodobacteraceae bacterium]|nr:putative C-S lyase [Paracoccaceae bacterium]